MYDYWAWATYGNDVQLDGEFDVLPTPTVPFWGPRRNLDLDFEDVNMAFFNVSVGIGLATVSTDANYYGGTSELYTSPQNLADVGQGAMSITNIQYLQYGDTFRTLQDITLHYRAPYNNIKFPFTRTSATQLNLVWGNYVNDEIVGDTDTSPASLDFPMTNIYQETIHADFTSCRESNYTSKLAPDGQIYDFGYTSSESGSPFTAFMLAMISYASFY